MTRRRGILSVVVALLAIALAACTGLPTSGPVNYGLPNDDAPDSDEVSFLLPDRPQPGASPEQIVEGFIRAGSGPGLNSNWDRAREFLTPALAATWKPQAGVLVDVFDDRGYEVPQDGIVQLNVTAVATVDDKGAYERAEVGGRQLPFVLEQRDDDEWRISQAPDGVVLDREEFPRVFHRYAVMYFDPTWEYLVPDARWFPPTNAPASVANALNGLPSAWLAESVTSAFVEGVEVGASVPVSGGVAEVDLSEAALSTDSETLDRMYTQLQASLGTAGVTQVELTVESTPIDAETVPVRSTRVTGAPLVLTENGFGFLTGGDQIEPIPGLSDVVQEFQPVAVQVSPDRDAAAVRVPTGEVLRLTDHQTDTLLDPRPALVDPTIDPFGYVWSVPSDAPADVHAFADDGTLVEVADAWSGATAIGAMAVSRDGTRIAAVVTAGGRTALWVAGIVRGRDQVPIRLGDPVQLNAVDGAGRGLAWVDDLSVGVLAGDAEGSVVLEQVIGGTSTSSAAAAGMAGIAGGTALSSVRLRAEDGTLFVERGASWQPTATGVLVLATQQGAPE